VLEGAVVQVDMPLAVRSLWLLRLIGCAQLMGNDLGPEVVDDDQVPDEVRDVKARAGRDWEA
jgi:hypothetical protein